jgi:hypothetical protein
MRSHYLYLYWYMVQQIHWIVINKHYLGSCIVLGSLTNNLGTLQILLILTEGNDDFLTESSNRRQLASDIHNRLHFSITFGCIFCWSVTGSYTIFQFYRITLRIPLRYRSLIENNVSNWNLFWQSLLSFRKYSAWINPIR